jgi:hypothetical protein
MARSLETFADTETVGDAELSGFLSKGDPQERVWAAWRLALRSEAQARDALPEVTTSAPHPGTRRNLLVVLAGLGRRDLLTVFACDEPDEGCRGEALCQLWRTSTRGEEDLAFIRNRLESESSESILLQLLRIQPELPSSAFRAELCLLMFEASSPQLRGRAYELMAGAGLSSAERLKLLVDPDPELRERFVDQALHHEGPWVTLESSMSNLPLRTSVLEHLRRRRIRLSARELVHRLGLPVLRNWGEEFDDLLAGPFDLEVRNWLWGRIAFEGGRIDAEASSWWAALTLAHAYRDGHARTQEDPPFRPSPEELVRFEQMEGAVADLDAEVDEGSVNAWDDPLELERRILDAAGRKAGRVELFYWWVGGADEV